MKILHITTLLNYGGKERTYVSLVQDKSILENEYFFVAIGHGGYVEKEISKKGFEVKVFNKNHSIRNLRNIWTLYKYIKKVKPDVVHTAAAEANLHGVMAAKLARVPYIVAEEIGFPNHSNLARKIFKFIYKFTKAVICVSVAVKDYLIKINEINEERGVVIYNPVDVNSNLDKIQTDFFTIVCIGRLEKVKISKY